MNLFQPLPGIERVRRSKPAALTSNQPKGFPVAPKPLRALSRNIVVITVTGAAIYETGAQCAPLRGTNSFHRCGGPPPSKREVLGIRRSKPAALPSIGYRGFAVAPITLRAPSRRVVVITSGTNGRASRARRHSTDFRFPYPHTSLIEGGGPPAGGGRSSFPLRGYGKRGNHRLRTMGRAPLGLGD